METAKTNKTKKEVEAFSEAFSGDVSTWGLVQIPAAPSQPFFIESLQQPNLLPVMSI